MRSPNLPPTSDPRRSFLKHLALGVTALPFVAEAALPKVHPWKPHAPIDENFWELVKKQFAVPSDMIMANSANLCPSPRFVNDRARHFQEELIRDVSFQNRAKYAETRKKTIQKLSDYLGVESAEVGVTRNTSESNNIIVNGLELGKGDEVIIWDENHPTNNLSWQQRAKRRGFKVKVVSIPSPPTSPEGLVQLFADQMTKHTRVMSFSHISNVSGIRMPAKELCQLAAERNILTLVDGAQSFGAMDLDLRAVGCDFYTASTHKWLMGPLENGVLYMKGSNIDKVW
ncbi:MAG: aminotransferase class V-fold PLP-dependent enzyme, partial [Bacteroidota bacterium]